MSTTPKAPYPQKNLSQDLKGFDQPSWKKAPPFTNSISNPLSRYSSRSPEHPSQGGTVLGKRLNPEESNSDSSNKSARKTGSGLVDYFARRQASADKVQNLTRDKPTSNDPFCDTSDDDPFFISHPPKLPVYPNFSKSTTDSSFNYVSKPDWSPPNFFTSASPTSLEHLQSVPFRIPSPPPFSGRLLPAPRLRSLLPDASGPAQVSPEVSRLKEEVAELKKKLENSEKKKEKPGSSLKRLIISERTLQDQIDSQKAINAGLNVSIDALADILVRKEETIKELRKGMKEKKGGEKPAKKKFKFTIEVEVDDEKLEGRSVSVEK